MRKSPTIKPRICDDCGIEYIPRGTSQRYCPDCGSARDRKRKQEWYERNFPDRKPKVKCSDVCCVCGSPFSSFFDGKPYCNKHWQRMYHNGTIEPKKRAKTNTYEIKGDLGIVTVKSGGKFLIDPGDMEKVAKYSWCFCKSGYPVAHVGGKVVRLHRYILQPPSDVIVDHINGNPADNRRRNLRLCSPKENARNTRATKGSKTGVVGVKMVKSGHFVAQIMVDRKLLTLGTFKTLEEAAAVRAEAEKKYYGEFSPVISRTSIQTPAFSE